MVHHTTFLINSWAHIFGTQPYSDQNTARDCVWLAFLTHGEGYHNYHHAFETDYRNGPRWYNFDPGKWLIWVLSKLGLARDMRRTPADVVLRRRYEEQKDDFAVVLGSLGQRIETWRDEVSERASQHAQAARSTLESHLLRAEVRVEAALSEMRAARNAYALARRNKASKREIRNLKSAAKNAHRTVKTALSEWESVLSDWTAMAAPSPA